jgi:ketosteroid isomerase-like protein
MDTRQLIESYHDAWTTGDIARARSCLAEDLDFRGSIDTFTKADEFVAALAQFQRMLRGVTVLESFFSKAGAALLYDCDTASPAGIVRTAEFFAVQNGKISEIRLVFDASELRKLMSV